MDTNIQITDADFEFAQAALNAQEITPQVKTEALVQTDTDVGEAAECPTVH